MMTDSDDVRSGDEGSDDESNWGPAGTVYAGLLVTLQFVLAAALVLTTETFPRGVVPWGLVAAGVGVAIWAWLTMGLRKIRVFPAPGRSMGLIDRGPYAWVRHPMYLGVLLFTAGLVAHDPRGWRIVAWVGLMGVLVAKASYEERILVRELPGYEAYQRRTWV